MEVPRVTRNHTRRRFSEAELALFDAPPPVEPPPHALHCEAHGWFRASECVRCGLERRGDTKQMRWRKPA